MPNNAMPKIYFDVHIVKNPYKSTILQDLPIYCWWKSFLLLIIANDFLLFSFLLIKNGKHDQVRSVTF